jgi:hypothetical protein
VTYIPANSLVQDYAFVNSPAILLTATYDGSGTTVSADTTIRVISFGGYHTNPTIHEFGKFNGLHSLNTSKLKIVSGDVSSDSTITNFTYDAFAEDQSQTSKFSTLTIPTCVQHLNRVKLGWEYGVTCNISESADTYDPGDGCNNRVSKTIKIPKTISDITNGGITQDSCNSDSCIKVHGSICVDSGKSVTAGAFYSTSDKNLKENINDIVVEEYSKVDDVKFKSFNFKDDKDKNKVYGVIAQDVESAGLKELVHKDENGNLSVDYTSLLLLKIASLEDTVSKLKKDIELLSEKVNLVK